MCAKCYAGDKTAYLVMHLTVMAVTVIQKRSGSLDHYLSRSKNDFFVLFHGIHGHRDSYKKVHEKSNKCHAPVNNCRNEPDS
jgi:hypothetical protein